MRFDIRPVPHDSLAGFTATGGLKQIVLKWQIPFVDASYRAAQVWMNTVNDRETATLVATVAGNTYTQAISDTNIRYFWIRVVNEFGRADGLWAGPTSATASLVNKADLAAGSIDLASSAITGALANNKVTGLGALALLSSVSAGNVSGLGALATQSQVNGQTQVTNLGSLAYASSIAANQIGAGTLAAGVVYAGAINADNVTSGTFTGRTFQTAASYGTYGRIVINNYSVGGSDAGKLVAYNSSGDRCIELGGGSGNLYVSTSSSLSPAIQANSSGYGMAAVSATATNTGSAVIASTQSSSGAAVRVYAGSGYAFHIAASSGAGIVQEAGSTNFMRTIVAQIDNTYELGVASNRWSQLYAVNPTIQTSDRRTKKDIVPCDLGLDFIALLKPVKYKLKVSKQLVTDIPVEPTEEVPYETTRHEVTPVEGTRDHYGLIAQDVKEALDTLGVQDAALWTMDDPNDPDSRQGLRYEGFIAPTIKAMQDMQKLLLAQGERIAALEAQLAAQKI